MDQKRIWGKIRKVLTGKPQCKDICVRTLFSILFSSVLQLNASKV